MEHLMSRSILSFLGLFIKLNSSNLAHMSSSSPSSPPPLLVGSMNHHPLSMINSQNDQNDSNYTLYVLYHTHFNITWGSGDPWIPLTKGQWYAKRFRYGIILLHLVRSDQISYEFIVVFLSSRHSLDAYVTSWTSSIHGRYLRRR